MQNRLVAENVVKTPLKGQSYFAINKKLLAYSLQQSLKIKSFNKQGKQFEIKLENSINVNFYELSKIYQWVYVNTSAQTLQIYSINQQSPQTIQKVLTIKGVLQSKQVNNSSIILDCTDGFYRVLPVEVIKSCISSNNKQIQLQKLYSLQKKSGHSSILQYPENSNIYIKNQLQNTDQDVITVYCLKKTNKYQKSLEIDYIKNPIEIFRDRYFFNLNKQNNISSIQIYDINESKLIGKIAVQGELKSAKIKQNLFSIVMNIDNTDFYWFYLLNPKPESSSTLITHRIVYQRGRGDYYQFINMKTSESLNFTDKKKQQILNDLLPQNLDNLTSSIIYVLNKQKQKVQIIKFDHSKLFESPFGQEKVQKKIVSNIVKNKIQEQKQSQVQQIQRGRIKSSLEHKAHGKTLQETQRKFVQAIIDTKVKNMMQKFQKLEQRVQKLEKYIRMIYEKVDQNIKSVNRQQIRTSVQSLFQQLTPQFQKYFSQLFKQVSGVLDQGVSFYNKKLATQAQIHKQALNQIVTRTFEQTEKIVELSKKQEKLSQRTEKHLNDLLQSRSKWQKKTEEFEQQSNGTFSNTKISRDQCQGKIFVRADLNLSSKKET